MPYISGYEFEEPVLLGDWHVFPCPGAYVLLLERDTDEDFQTLNAFDVIYVGRSEREGERIDASQPRWNRFHEEGELYIAFHEMPGSTESERAAVENEIKEEWSPPYSEI